MQPLVSVVMPAYNAEQYIGLAIESILNQTYNNFELIIVEDCSTDNTFQIVQNYKDIRIKLLKNNFNRGIAFSTNKGLELSGGKYIALLDDDDIAVKERLALQVEYLEKHEDIDILGGRSAFIDEKGNIFKYQDMPRNNPKYIKAMLLFNNAGFCNGTVMIRKEFIEKNDLGYQENCYGMQDFKFFINSSKLGNISTISDLLLYYRIHENNETTRRKAIYEEERRLKYAEFQRESLKASGFKLDGNNLSIINKALSEDNLGCSNEKELELLYRAFVEIMRQAKLMKVDYYKELEHYCKKKFSDQIVKLIQF